MLYSTFISQLRSQVGDTKIRNHTDNIGDGTTTVFQMETDTFPVLDDTSTYTVKLAGVLKTETTDYIFDKVTGTLTMVVAPGNGVALTIDSIAVHLLNADWLQIMNDVIRSLGDDFWKEFIDTAHVTTANMLSLSLVALQANCIAVYGFQHRKSTTEDWRNVENYTNWRYDRDNNIIYLGTRTAFTVANESFRIRGLKTYTLGTAIGDTIDVQDKFLTIIEYGCIARYYRWRYKSVIELVSKMTTESSRTPLQELVMISDRFDRLYEQEKAKLKPMKPSYIIPQYREAGGRP